MPRPNPHLDALTLHAFAGGELPWLASRRVKRHIDRCGACSIELQAIKRLSKIMRSADLIQSPKASAPKFPQHRQSNLRAPLPARRIGLDFAAMLIVVGFLAARTMPRAGRDPSACVVAAVSHVSTWHLHG